MLVDSKTDVAAYRPSGRNWYMGRCAAGYAAVHFGISKDRPSSPPLLFIDERVSFPSLH